MSGTSHAPGLSDATVDRLFAQAGAARWGLARDRFADGLRDAWRRRLGSADAADDEVIAASVNAQDLALAIACAEGLAPAWDHFVLTYRPELYRAARAMTDEATGRELADSLYADLFGLAEKDGVRRSLFRYYHGRSKLSTWLRSVLAQRHVDLVRAQRRTASLDDPDHSIEARLPAAPAGDPSQAAAMRVAAEAVSVALAALAIDDRRRLAYYYVHGLKLAATGRLLGESEATASRKLERARTTLRAGIEAGLRTRGLATADVDDWAAVARQAWDAALADALGVPAPQETGPPPFKGKKTP